MSLLHLPAQHQWTSLSVAIFKKATSRRESSSLRPDGNYSTFAWWVRRVRTYACMYVRVLERTLAAVGRNFSSFISPAWIDEKKPLSLFFSPFFFFHVESGSLSLCSSSECSSLAAVSRRAFWSGVTGVSSRRVIVVTLGLSDFSRVFLSVCWKKRRRKSGKMLPPFPGFYIRWHLHVEERFFIS